MSGFGGGPSGNEPANNYSGGNDNSGPSSDYTPPSTPGPTASQPSTMQVKPAAPPAPERITDFLSESQATQFRQGDRLDSRDEGPEEFIKTSELGEALGNVLGGTGAPLKGFSPFDAKRARRGFMTGQGKGFSAEVPEQDAVVERQNDNPGVTPGGEVGVGAQGFGARALTGGEGEVVNNMAPPGAEQSETPVAQAQSDLQADPNMPVPTPQAPLAPDVNYVLPTAGQSQLIAFAPNDPNAVYTARGPLSRNLITARTGFGSKFS